MSRRRCLDSSKRPSFDAAGNLITVTDWRTPRVVVDANGQTVVNPTQRQLRDLLKAGDAHEYVYRAGTHPTTALRHTRRFVNNPDSNLNAVGAYTHQLPSLLFRERNRLEVILQPFKRGTHLFGTRTAEMNWARWVQDAGNARDALNLYNLHARLVATGFSFYTPHTGQTHTTSDQSGVCVTPEVARMVVADPARARRVAALVSRTRSGHDPNVVARLADLSAALDVDVSSGLALFCFDTGLRGDDIAGLTAAQLAAFAVMCGRGVGVDAALSTVRHAPLRELKKVAAGLDATASNDHLLSWATGSSAQWHDWLALHLQLSPLDVSPLVADVPLGNVKVAKAIAGMSPKSFVAARHWCSDVHEGDRYALRGALAFGPRIGEWRHKMEKASVNAHDALHWLPVFDNRNDANEFARWALTATGRSGDVTADLTAVKQVAQSWEHIPRDIRFQPDGQPQTLTTVARWVGSQTYGPASSTPLADVLTRHKVGARRAARAAAVWAPSATEVSWLPAGTRQFTTNGSAYTWEFLPRSAGETLFIGEETDCCQSVGGVGETCAIYSQTHPTSGVFVVRDRHNKIIAQSWVWLSADSTAVFDNVERLTSGVDNSSRSAAVRSCVIDAARTLTKIGVPRVHIGTRMSGIALAGFARVKRSETAAPFEYAGYSDAQTQVLAATGNPPLLVRPSNGAVLFDVGTHTVRMVRDPDLTVQLAHCTVEPVGEHSGPLTPAAARIVAHTIAATKQHATSPDPTLAAALTAQGVNHHPYDSTALLGDLAELVKSGVDIEQTITAAASLPVLNGSHRYDIDDDDILGTYDYDWSDHDDILGTVDYDWPDDDRYWRDTTWVARAVRHSGIATHNHSRKAFHDSDSLAIRNVARRLDVPGTVLHSLPTRGVEAACAAYDAGVPGDMAALFAAAGLVDADDMLTLFADGCDRRILAACVARDGVARTERRASDVAADMSRTAAWVRHGFETDEAAILAAGEETPTLPVPAHVPPQLRYVFDEYDTTHIPVPQRRKMPQWNIRKTATRTHLSYRDSGYDIVTPPVSAEFRPAWEDSRRIATNVFEQFGVPPYPDPVTAGAVSVGLALTEQPDVGDIVAAVAHLAPAHAWVRPGAAAPLRELLANVGTATTEQFEERWQQIDPFPHAQTAGTVVAAAVAHATELRTAAARTEKRVPLRVRAVSGRQTRTLRSLTGL
jgi:hypothetical protein